MEINYLGKCLVVRGVGETILVVGDLHLGYEESLNVSGVLISREMLKGYLDYLKKIFEVIGKVDKVVLLGDVKHDFGSILKQEWNDVLKLFGFLLKNCGEIIVVKGNHDNYIKNIAGKMNVRVEDYYILGEICFLHGHKDFEEIWNKRIKYLIVGHAHPAVKLSDGVKVEKYKCFFNW